MNVNSNRLCLSCCRASVDEPSGKSLELVDAAIAQERPPAANVLAALHVHLDYSILFPVHRCLIKHLALRSGYKAAAPKLNATGLPARIGLVSYAVDGNDGNPVSHSMTALYGDPGFALALLLLRRIAALVWHPGGP